jgi:hypothetical protein
VEAWTPEAMWAILSHPAKQRHYDSFGFADIWNHETPETS